MNRKYKSQIDYILNALNETAYALEKYNAGGQDADFFYYAAQKKTEESVQTAISINQDVLADYFNYVSKSYFDSFIELEKLKAFSKNELEKIAKTSGFRNQLIHEYTDLDREIVLKSMEQVLKLYPKYLQKIKEWLDKQ